jgi:small subunit ribosomal protein S2
MIDFKQLVKAGVHFGHRTSVWCPKMQPYIWGHKNNVHLIDVSKTAFQLEKAAQFLEGVASEGKSILWIGTKKAAQESIRSTAERLSMPYVNHRWIGGTLSNYPQVKKSVTKLLHYEDVIAKDSNSTFYTKKELNRFGKSIDRLKTNIGGIINLRWPLGAVVLVDVNKESSALREAASMRIPVVALVDTNSDPSLVSYVVPGNDDAPRSIKLIIDYLEEAARRGQEVAKTKGETAVEEHHEEEEPLLATLSEEEGEEEGNGRKGPRKTTENGKKFIKKVGDDTGAEGSAKHRSAARPRVSSYNAPKKANNKPS